METFRLNVVELWNQALLTYRTMVIKAESRRRSAIARKSQYSNKSRSTTMLHTQNRTESDKDSHNMTVADVFSTTVTPRTMFNRNPSEMKRVFDLFDENKDGFISGEELQLFMKRLGFELSDQNVRDMVGTIDKNNDESVDFEEFFSLYSFLCGGGDDLMTEEDTSTGEDGHEEETLLKVFFVFDENKDGLISALELQQVLLRLGLPEGKSLKGCEKMIEKVDTDGNGKVDFFEFKDMMCSDAFSFCRS